MTDCQHKQLILTSQRGTDGFPIYSCGVPLDMVKRIVRNIRVDTESLGHDWDASEWAVAEQSVLRTLHGCGALFKVKPEEITVEQQLSQDEIDFMNAPLGPVAPPNFEQWWLDFAKRPESDALDDFTLDEQAKIAGIVRDAWAALAATNTAKHSPTLRVQPDGDAFADKLIEAIKARDLRERKR